jgi:putative transposase
MIEPEHPKDLPIARQCELLGLPGRATTTGRSRRPTRTCADAGDRRDVPGVPGLRLAADARWLRRQGYPVNRKRVRRLMLQMGLEAIYQKPNTVPEAPAQPGLPLPAAADEGRAAEPGLGRGHHLHPDPGRLHLPLRGDGLVQPGGPRLGAVEHARRRLLRPGRVQRAIAEHGVPEIFNTDQGCQFTSAEFTQPLLALGIKLSMDGRGRALDNVFVERLWRTVKYDEVYLKSYRSQIDAYTNLATFFRFYNDRGPTAPSATRQPGDADGGLPLCL